MKAGEGEKTPPSPGIMSSGIMSPGILSVKPYRSAAEIQVRAYGQLCNIQFDAYGNLSLATMKSSVQTQLGMKEQSIILHDVDGNALSSDALLQQACEAGRVPLQVLLADTAIHDMEMKRDEIAQMQWRVVREQFTSVNKSTNAMSAQLTELRTALNQQKAELTMLEERLRTEVRGIIAKEAAERHDELMNTCSRVDELAKAVHTEQGAREVVAMQHQMQIDSTKLEVQGQRQKWELEVNQIRAELNCTKTGIYAEMKSSEQVFNGKMNDVKILERTCQELGKLVREETQERQSMHQSILEKVAASSETLEVQFVNAQGAQQMFKNDLTDRIRKLDDVTTQLLTKMSEKLDTQMQAVIACDKRCDALGNELESNDVKQKKNLEIVKQATEKLIGTVDQIKNFETHYKAMIEQEQQSRTAQGRALWNAISLYTREAKSPAGTMTPRSAKSVQIVTPNTELRRSLRESRDFLAESGLWPEGSSASGNETGSDQGPADTTNTTIGIPAMPGANLFRFDPHPVGGTGTPVRPGACTAPAPYPVYFPANMVNRIGFNDPLLGSLSSVSSTPSLRTANAPIRPREATSLPRSVTTVSPSPQGSVALPIHNPSPRRHSQSPIPVRLR